MKIEMKRFFNISLGDYQQHTAFTLAEVLITLGIIGVVASMTIPTLIQSYQEKQTVIALKKSYSLVSQAYTMAVEENGTPEQWDLGISLSPDAAAKALNILVPYLRINKNCGAAIGCWPSVGYKYLNKLGSESPNAPSFWASANLTDGTLIAVLIRNINCTDQPGTIYQLKAVCGDIGIDVNGYKGPNTFGKDYFRFHFTKYGIIPKGTSTDSWYGFGGCLPAVVSTSEGCAAWVIYNENMDYLHCNDLAWGGKTKCN